jgi:hypothetical protein
MAFHPGAAEKGDPGAGLSKPPAPIPNTSTVAAPPVGVAAYTLLPAQSISTSAMLPAGPVPGTGAPLTMVNAPFEPMLNMATAPKAPKLGKLTAR